jgi:hypothetical protein
MSTMMPRNRRGDRPVAPGRARNETCNHTTRRSEASRRQSNCCPPSSGTPPASSSRREPSSGCRCAPKKIALGEPALDWVVEKSLRLLAHKEKAEGVGLSFPHDGFNVLEQAVIATLGGLGGGAEPLQFGQVLEGDEQAAVLARLAFLHPGDG